MSNNSFAVVLLSFLVGRVSQDLRNPRSATSRIIPNGENTQQQSRATSEKGMHDYRNQEDGPKMSCEHAEDNFEKKRKRGENGGVSSHSRGVSVSETRGWTVSQVSFVPRTPDTLRTQDLLS